MQQLDPVDAGGPGGFKNIANNNGIGGVVELGTRLPGAASPGLVPGGVIMLHI